MVVEPAQDVVGSSKRDEPGEDMEGGGEDGEEHSWGSMDKK